ncbi:MAG TPA: hypothetical protein VK850_17680 [Candidatus Binatia bacterium]|nr:hypothetical protein [Candidatus Binatia bacterium]
MKTRLFTAFLAFSVLMTFCVPSRATEDSGISMVTDAVIARPLCLAATALGSVFFVAMLPLSIPTKTVNRTAQALVVTPYKATFTRQLGDFESLKE